MTRTAIQDVANEASGPAPHVVRRVTDSPRCPYGVGPDGLIRFTILATVFCELDAMLLGDGAQLAAKLLPCYVIALTPRAYLMKPAFCKVAAAIVTPERSVPNIMAKYSWVKRISGPSTRS